MTIVGSEKRQLPICVSVSPLSICVFVCISLTFGTVLFWYFCLYFFGVMFVFLHTFAFGHISGEGGKQSAQELESASRRPTAVPTTSVVGGRPPRKFSTTPVFSFHWDLLRL